MTTISERGGATLPTISRNLILLPQNRVNGNRSGPSGPGSQHITLNKIKLNTYQGPRCYRLFKKHFIYCFV